jgi:hypothetical protein
MIEITLKDGTKVAIVEDDTAEDDGLCKSCHVNHRTKMSTLDFCYTCHSAWITFKKSNGHLFPEKVRF